MRLALYKSLHFAFAILLLLAIICLLVPFYPHFPYYDLDVSWQMGLNHAIAQGFTFGKQFIWTHGPYGPIATQLYHHATDSTTIIGSLYLAITLWLSLMILARHSPFRWFVILTCTFATILHASNSLILSLPLTIGLACFKAIHSKDREFLSEQKSLWMLALLFMSFGLLPLIKGSFLANCFIVPILCAWLFYKNNFKIHASLALIVPAASILLFWFAAGQPLENLLSYLKYTATISEGYSEAMAYASKLITITYLDLILYLGTSLFLMTTIAMQKQTKGFAKFFLMILVFISLLLSFKSGFVRHDDGHAPIAATGLLFTVLLMPFIFCSRITKYLLAGAFAASILIYTNHLRLSANNIHYQIRNQYLLSLLGIERRVTHADWFETEYTKATEGLYKRFPLPQMTGTTDIYSLGQGLILISGNTWAPRPVMQSYSVYTPELIDLNRQHLLGTDAPDHVVMRLEPLDDRIPPLDDGASWPVLLQKYNLTEMYVGYLFLEKNQNFSEFVENTPIKNVESLMGEVVPLPEHAWPLFAQFKIEPTFLGRITNFFYKLSPLKITLELETGAKPSYKIIARMAASGFVLSPLIENTSELAELFKPSKNLQYKRVKSLIIEPADGKSLLWNEKYSVSFSKVETTGH